MVADLWSVHLCYRGSLQSFALSIPRSSVHVPWTG